MMPEQSVPPPTRGRGLVTVGAVTAAISLVLTVVSGVLIVTSVGGPLVTSFTSPARATPLDVCLVLEAGRFTVFEKTPVGVTSSTTVTADDVTVTGPDGASIPTSNLSSTETMTRDDASFTGAVRFRAPVDGSYRVRVDTPPGTEVVIAPAFGTGFRAVLRWFAIGAISTVTLLVGIVLVIIGLVRRRSGRNRAQPPHPTAPNAVPAGWYPAPDVPGRQRFWNGQAWTDQLQ